MFGSASYSGNEQCQKTNPNCIAVYGPGVIALAFQWEYYDAVLFLLYANKGYPMTISDIAATFQSKGSLNGPVATVKCDQTLNMASARNLLSEGSDPSKCWNPRFFLKRGAIILPDINQSASQVYDRIIPKPGGDCALVRIKSAFILLKLVVELVFTV